jgi:hypothetical protein
MKNIFFIETDKPTGIFETNSGLRFSIMNKVRYGEFKGFHLYITNDEEIKDGDWAICSDYKSSYQKVGKVSHIGGPFNFKNTIQLNGNPDLHIDREILDYAKKIILTTDWSLKGVQSIDIEFLEWFVKNPTCEYAHIGFIAHNDIREYKIIIPQEEPKTGSLLESIQEVTKDLLREINELKQETLEEIPKELEPILAKISHLGKSLPSAG